MLANHSDADDLTQEAFLRAYRGLGGFDRRADFGTWIYRIVVNAALNLLRARKRARERAVEAPPAEAPANRRSGAESRELLDAVVGALAELSPTLRITLILATLEEMSYREIAAALDIPEGTVAWRVNQARKVLRQKLAEKGSVDEMLRRTKEALGAR
jgi:RNA polymerase sigma-70 factor, ECF subfamily